MKLITPLMILMCCVGGGMTTYGNEKKSLEPQKESVLVIHRYQDLKRFVLPEITFEKVAAKEAIGMLLEKYQKACEVNHEKPLDFELHIRGEPVGVIDTQLSGNFDYILSQLCAMSGMELKRSGGKVSLTACDDDKTPIVIGVENSRLVLYHLGEKRPLKDVFAQILEDCHAGEVVKMRLGQSGEVLITGERAAGLRVQRYLKNIVMLELWQIRTTINLIHYPTPQLSPTIQKLINTGAQGISREQVSQLLDASKSMKMVSLSLPSVLSRSGEEAKIQLIKEIPFASDVAPKKKGFDPKDGKFTKDEDVVWDGSEPSPVIVPLVEIKEVPREWIGHQLVNKPKMAGFGTRSQMRYTYHYLPEMKMTDVRDMGGAGRLSVDTKFKEIATESVRYAQSGMTYVVQIHFPDDSSSLYYLLVSDTIVDASGVEMPTPSRP